MSVQKLAPKKIEKKLPAKRNVVLSPAIELADTPVEPETDFNKMSILLMGDRKVGKTSLLSQFEDPYFLMAEDGAKFLKIRRTQCPDWDTVLKTVEALERKPKGYAQNYIQDTGFKMYEHCFRWTINDLGLDDIRDEGWGNGWSKVNENFLQVQERILRLGGGYIATAHTETSEIKRRDGTTFTKTKAELSKQAYRWFTSFVDLIAYFTYDQTGKRVLHIRGDAEIESGCRPPTHFFYPDGSEIKTIPMGGNPQDAYNNFISAFNNELPLPKGVTTLIKKPLLKKQ